MGWNRDGLVGALLEKMILLGHLTVAWPECKLLSSDWESLISNTLSPRSAAREGVPLCFLFTEVTNMDDRGRQLFI